MPALTARVRDRREERQFLNLAAEVAAVERSAEDHLAEALQLAPCGLLRQLPLGCGGQVLVFMNEAARQCPGPTERLLIALDQEDLQPEVLQRATDCEQDDIHRHGGARPGVRSLARVPVRQAGGGIC